MTTEHKVCPACNDTGHDANSRPLVKLEPYTDSKGATKRRHVTKQQGSGCLVCGGKVV